eukprot:Awhi_evm1s13756
MEQEKNPDYSVTNNADFQYGEKVVDEDLHCSMNIDYQNSTSNDSFYCDTNFNVDSNEHLASEMLSFNDKAMSVNQPKNMESSPNMNFPSLPTTQGSGNSLSNSIETTDDSNLQALEQSKMVQQKKQVQGLDTEDLEITPTPLSSSKTIESIGRKSFQSPLNSVSITEAIANSISVSTEDSLPVKFFPARPLEKLPVVSSQGLSNSTTTSSNTYNEGDAQRNLVSEFETRSLEKSLTTSLNARPFPASSENSHRLVSQSQEQGLLPSTPHEMTFVEQSSSIESNLKKNSTAEQSTIVSENLNKEEVSRNATIAQMEKLEISPLQQTKDKVDSSLLETPNKEVSIDMTTKEFTNGITSLPSKASEFSDVFAPPFHTLHLPITNTSVSNHHSKVQCQLTISTKDSATHGFSGISSAVEVESTVATPICPRSPDYLSLQASQLPYTNNMGHPLKDQNRSSSTCDLNEESARISSLSETHVPNRNSFEPTAVPLQTSKVPSFHIPIDTSIVGKAQKKAAPWTSNLSGKQPASTSQNLNKEEASPTAIQESPPLAKFALSNCQLEADVNRSTTSSDFITQQFPEKSFLSKRSATEGIASETKVGLQTSPLEDGSSSDISTETYYQKGSPISKVSKSTIQTKTPQSSLQQISTHSFSVMNPFKNSFMNRQKAPTENIQTSSTGSASVETVDTNEKPQNFPSAPPLKSSSSMTSLTTAKSIILPT